jgi:hypothetical protein
MRVPNWSLTARGFPIGRGLFVSGPPVSPMRGVHKNRRLRPGSYPSAVYMTTRENQRMDARLIDHREFQIAVVRYVFHGLPLRKTCHIGTFKTLRAPDLAARQPRK